MKTYKITIETQSLISPYYEEFIGSEEECKDRIIELLNSVISKEEIKNIGSFMYYDDNGIRVFAYN